MLFAEQDLLFVFQVAEVVEDLEPNRRARKSSLMTKPSACFTFLNGLWFHPFSELLDIPESITDIYLTVNGHFSPLFRPLKPSLLLCATQVLLTFSSAMC